MDKDEKTDNFTPITLKFGFLIEKTIKGNIQELSIQTDNQRISEPEVILIMQSWLDKFKDIYTGTIKDNLNFFKK